MGDSKADEFVEIVNVTNRPIDLTFLTVYDSHSERHRFLNPTSLPPGGAIVVFGAGTPHGFAASHQNGSAQSATSGELALNNTSDSVQLITLPSGLSMTGDVIFRVDYTNPPTGSSVVSRTDGQPITANPATDADYQDHNGAPGAAGLFSPGRRIDDSPF